MSGSCPGKEVLAVLHQRIGEAVGPTIVEDEVSPEHAGSHYSPHITLGWGVEESQVQELRRCGITKIAAQVRSIALAQYPDPWPGESPVEIVQSFPLGNDSLRNNAEIKASER